MYRPKDIIEKRSGGNWKYNPKTDVVIKRETVSGKMRPAANGEQGIAVPGNNFRPRPMKHWRKQRVPVYPAHGFTDTKTLKGTFEIPGGTHVVNKNSTTLCDPCSNQYVVPSVDVTYRPKNDVNNQIGHYAPTTFSDYTDYINQCAPNHNKLERCVAVCDPEKNARTRVRYPSAINTDPSKPKYYQSNASYMYARCRTYNQNNFQYGNNDVSKCDNLVSPTAFRPNCQGCTNCKNKKVSYYKPNNCKFAQQGGVSSSSRIARLKYDTITTFANGFINNPNFGPNVANAYAYSGRPDAPFTIKNKMFNCQQNAGQFRKMGNPNINCS